MRWPSSLVVDGALEKPSRFVSRRSVRTSSQSPNSAGNLGETAERIEAAGGNTVPNIFDDTDLVCVVALLYQTPYTASKMAVIGLTRTLAFELGDDDVTVNAVCPGATRGPRIDDVIRNQADQRGISVEAAKEQVFTGYTALGRLTDPEDVAAMVVYLASDRGRNVTAQDLNVDAGTTWY